MGCQLYVIIYLIYFLILSQFTDKKKYAAEGHKYLNNLSFLMIVSI